MPSSPCSVAGDTQSYALIVEGGRQSKEALGRGGRNKGVVSRSSLLSPCC